MGDWHSETRSCSKSFPSLYFSPPCLRASVVKCFFSDTLTKLTCKRPCSLPVRAFLPTRHAARMVGRHTTSQAFLPVV